MHHNSLLTSMYSPSSMQYLIVIKSKYLATLKKKVIVETHCFWISFYYCAITLGFIILVYGTVKPNWTGIVNIYLNWVIKSLLTVLKDNISILAVLASFGWSTCSFWWYWRSQIKMSMYAVFLRHNTHWSRIQSPMFCQLASLHATLLGPYGTYVLNIVSAPTNPASGTRD